MLVEPGPDPKPDPRIKPQPTLQQYMDAYLEKRWRRFVERTEELQRQHESGTPLNELQ